MEHTHVLEALVTCLSPEPPLIRELCEIAKRNEAKLQTGATWLLKRLQENGMSFAST